MTRVHTRAGLVSALVVLSACSSSKENGGAGGAGGAPMSPQADAGAADPAATIGAFDIKLVAAMAASGSSAGTPAFTSIQGRVGSTPRAPTLQLNLAAQEGDCRLYTPTAPFCDPPCSGGTCVTGGKCVPDPQPRSVGEVTITGVATEPGSKPVAMKPDPPGFYQPDGDVKTSFPPFAEGDEVLLKAAGAELPAFQIAGKGIKLLEVPSEMPIPAAKDKPLPVRWQAGRTDVARVEVTVEISHHGGFKGSLTCDTTDSGSLDIPAALVTKLIDLGTAGWPTVTITRRATGHAQLATGRVDLNVISGHVLPLVVEGNVSCNEDFPCPAGKTCQQNQLCR